MSQTDSPRQLSVISAPFNSDGTPPETENPARALLDAGLLARLRNGGVKAESIGEIAIPRAEGVRDEESGVLNLRAWQDVSRQLANRMTLAGKTSDETIVLGGDCSILVGIFGALRSLHGECALLMLDAHTDFWDPRDSATGEPSDSEIAVLTGYAHSVMTELFGDGPLLREDHTRIMGVRSPDQITRSRIEYHLVADTLNHGIDTAYNTAVGPLLAHQRPIWIHFDVDCISRQEMPAVAFPGDEGFSFAQVEHLLRGVRRDSRVLGMSVCCYRPTLDTGGDSARRLVESLARSIHPAR